jgi:hypothetical protein
LDWPYAELWLADEGDESLERIGPYSAPRRRSAGARQPPGGQGRRRYRPRLAGGRALWVPDLSDATDPVAGETPRHTEACVRAGLHAVVSVPVRDGQTTLGVLTCYAGVPEPHEDLLAG